MNRWGDDNLGDGLAEAEIYVSTQEMLRLTVDKDFRARFTMSSVHKPFLPINQLHRTLATPSQGHKGKCLNWDTGIITVSFVYLFSTSDSQHTLR